MVWLHTCAGLGVSVALFKEETEKRDKSRVQDDPLAAETQRSTQVTRQSWRVGESYAPERWHMTSICCQIRRICSEMYILLKGSVERQEDCHRIVYGISQLLGGSCIVQYVGGVDGDEW